MLLSRLFLRRTKTRKTTVPADCMALELDGDELKLRDQRGILHPVGSGSSVIVRTAVEGPPQDYHPEFYSFNHSGSPIGGAEELIEVAGFGVSAFSTDGGASTASVGSWCILYQPGGVGNTWKFVRHVDGVEVSSVDSTNSPDAPNLATWPTFYSCTYTAPNIGTVPDRLDQACIVGDAGKNKLEYSAVQLDPVQWQLVTAGVIWNETDEQFEKLVVRDGTIQTDLYPLT